MLQSQFLNHIKNPTSLNEQHLQELEAISTKYPFFATSQLLLTKLLHQQNSINYSKQLRKTALVVNSRKVLFEIINSEANVEKDIPVKLNKVVEEEKTPILNNENTPPSSTHITSNDVKVIYINTVSITQPQTNEIAPETHNATNTSVEKSELDLVKEIENNTPQVAENNEVTENKFDEEKLNKEIEDEIYKGVVTSFIQSEVIKTPQLDEIKNTEPVSFTDWLQKVQKESPSIQKTEEKPVKIDKIEGESPKTTQKSTLFKERSDLINKIIESDPGRIKLTQNKFFTPAIDSKQSLIENEHLVTETLAKIYALQGNITKAIRAYEILSLKFPQKSVYFATLIQNLKTNK